MDDRRGAGLLDVGACLVRALSGKGVVKRRPYTEGFLTAESPGAISPRPKQTNKTFLAADFLAWLSRNQRDLLNHETREREKLPTFRTERHQPSARISD